MARGVGALLHFFFGAFVGVAMCIAWFTDESLRVVMGNLFRPIQTMLVWLVS